MDYKRPVFSKLPDVGTSIFAVMSGLANEVGAINLSQGFPDFPISGELIELVSRFMREWIQSICSNAWSFGTTRRHCSKDMGYLSNGL
jgi:aspartate/methionine/tyrosine aminotransferase